MGGSIDVDVPAATLTENAVQTTVCLYDGESDFRLLPNIWCEQIEFQIGPTPSTARLRYVLDHSVETDYPTQFEQVWPVTSRGPYVVQADDRIVIIAWTPEGKPLYLFDGFAQIPQANLTPRTQAVTFTAVGVEARCWDVPIGGRTQRDGSDVQDPNGDNETDLPTRFNPSDGRGGVQANCTPAGYDANQATAADRYPVFIEPLLNNSTLRFWTISEALCYILGVHNDQEYVENPPFDELRDKVVAKRGNQPEGVIDPADPATWVEQEIPLRDLDVTNKLWPDVVETLLSQVGLGFYFDIEANDQGLPKTKIKIERRDATTRRPKTIRLDEFRSAIDPWRSNVAGISMSRDVNQVVNAWLVETPPRRYEISVVLAPGFTPSAGDCVGLARDAFKWSVRADATLTNRRKYRYYIADECGEGHWNGSSFVTGDWFDFSAIFPNDPEGRPTYCTRFRPGERQLITKDSAGKPKTATLHYSQDYSLTYPAMWTGSGTWTEIPRGWKLLEDRLGIEVMVEEPESWPVGSAKDQLKGITWQANPPTGKRFYLLLTTVIEDDIMLDAEAKKRVASPTRFSRLRRIDARDHYKKEVVASYSWFNQTANEVVSRDDTDKALDLAKQYRMANEMAPFAGTVQIPYLTRQYSLFDRVKQIDGRNIDLRTNIASESGEGARYPYVVKVAWTFSGERQQTTLHLSDLRGEPPRA
jgi:hypothetical protein